MNIGLYKKELHIDARRPRTFVIRALFVGVVFVFVWFSWFTVEGNPRSSDAALGRGIFTSLMGTEFLLLMCMIPIVSVSTFITEKQTHSLDMLLITHLMPREIVMKKFYAKALVAATLILAGLPLSALTMVYGGVSPEQVVVAFLIMISTSFAVVALSLRVSLNHVRIEKAVVGTWLRTLGLFLAPWLLSLLLAPLMLVVGPLALVFFASPPVALYVVLVEGTAEMIVVGLLGVIYAIAATVWFLRKSIAQFALYAKTLDAHLPDPAASIFASPPSGMNIVRLEGKRIFRITDPVVMLENIRGVKSLFTYLVIVIVTGFGLAFLATCVTVNGVNMRPDDPTQTARTLAEPVRWIFLLFAVLAAATSFSSLRENRALDLVLLTRVTPSALVFGKLWSILKIILPLFVAHTVLWLVGRGSVVALATTLLSAGFLIMGAMALSIESRSNVQALFFSFLLFVLFVALPGLYQKMIVTESLVSRYPVVLLLLTLLFLFWHCPRRVGRVVGA